MKTTKLIATVMVAGLLFAACKQDPDYVLPNISVDTPELVFTSPSAAALPLKLTATREWTVRSKPDWITVAPADKGPASADPQALEVHAAANASYNQEGEIIFSIGLSKVAVKVTQPGEKGEIPVGSGTKEDPYTVTGVLRYIATLGADVESPQDVYVTGVIATVTEAFSAQYGNATFTIKEAGTDGSTFFTFYRGYYLGNNKWKEGDTQIKENDEVILCGKVINFKGNTPETQQNKAYVYSLNGETQGSGGNASTPSGTGTQADPYNAAGANAFIQTLADNAKSDNDVYIKGKISRIAVSKNVEQYFTKDYGNASFYISDDGNTGGTEFYCYQVLYLGNVKWKEGDTQIKVGDEVIICGKVTKYVSSYGTTPETARNEAYILSLNGTTAGSGGSGGNEGGGNEGGGNEGGGGTVTSATYSKVTTITSGGKYLLVGLKGDKYYAATPIASDKTYGRLSGKETTVTGDAISGDMSTYEFTITSVEGGYTIAMPDGRKLAVDTEHDGTFQIGDNFDPVFTAELADGLFKIVHKNTGKTIYHGGGTFTNFSCATTVPEDGTLLQLYLKAN